MAKITKETAAHFQALAREAKFRRAQARKKAQTLAESLLSKGYDARQTRQQLDVQGAALHDLIMMELASGAKRTSLLKQLIGVQRMLIDQVMKLTVSSPGSTVPDDYYVEPLTSMAEEDPEAVTTGIQRALATARAEPHIDAEILL